MRVDHATRLARFLMDRYGLTGWSIELKPWVTTAGKCYRHRSTIALSVPIIEANRISAVRDLILHEIAHALTTGGHDVMWKKVAESIGAHPSPHGKCIYAHARSNGRIKLECWSCRRVYHRHRRPKRNSSCRRCGGSKYNAEFKLKVAESTS